ncbi:LLGL scribble cell polarity complex component 2-like [Homarus americanus]|uniref:LLGL scribble cell polarity complex component 2-like n=1 Tax=Homarus americanus TaxID=6706 RepID=A0A8J5MJL7_HOMAM|nr:LLGL scribble cell polarity complex component 2-like [Homarus americanus]
MDAGNSYGTPGVELYGQDENSESAITHLIFLQGQCRLVSLCEDNSLHLWQLKQLDDSGSMQLTQANSTSLEGKLKKISVVVADSKCEHLMVGTEGGNIYLLNLSTFAMSDNIIYQDVVMQNVPEDYKVNPGPVEAIAEHPTEPNKILIGYQRGLIVLWDKKNLCADQTYVCSQQLESVCWHSDASHFTTSHNDGSYMVWSATESAQPTDGPHTVYGPFPCKPITKILRPTGKDEDFIVFSGGMPRASYGDRNTVTVILGDYHVTFNLTSKVIDFVLVKDSETGHASCLAILAEEEAVFIDLETEEWPAFAAPYLASLHSSAITCSVLASSVAEDVFDKIKEAGSKQQTGLSTRPWPINGGKIKNTDEPKQRDVLLTGHEDGTVQFWDASGVSLTLLYKIQTSQLFVSEDLGGDGASAEDDDWPPFRKAGLFDPYSDDPRLGVKKMEICPYTGTLIVAGTAGQVLVLNLTMEEKEIVPECVKVNVVAENDNFVWKSHNKLDMKTEAVKFDPGMQPTVVVQFFPPASCTSLNLHSEWGLIACGTAHGFALFDIIQKKNLLAKSTLSPLDIANAADEGPMSRRKSLKKSLRESFRRLRRGRSQRKTGRPGPTSPTSTHPQSPDEEVSEEAFDMSDEGEGDQETQAETGRPENGDQETQSETERTENGDQETQAKTERTENGEQETQSDNGAQETQAERTENGAQETQAETERTENGAQETQAETERTENGKQQIKDKSHISPSSSREVQIVETLPPVGVSQAVEEEIVRADLSEDPEGEIMEVDEESEAKTDDPSSTSGKRSSEAVTPITEPVPFFYYVTPKIFRESSRKKDKDKSCIKESDLAEQPASSPVLTPKVGVNRFRDWLQRREAGEVTKVEGVEPGQSREGSLRRLLCRSKSEAAGPSAQVTEGEVTDNTVESSKESTLSRRQRLMLAFRQRPSSVEVPVPSECSQSPNIKESQAKSRSLTRPRKLWIGGRSQSEQQASPDPSEGSPANPAMQDPAMTPAREPRKRPFHLFLIGPREPKEHEPDAPQKSIPLESPEDVSTQHSPSYDMAIGGTTAERSESSEGNTKPEGSSGKFKKFLRQQSEIILRPFSRRTADQDKRKSAPVPTIDLTAPQESAVELSDLEARHPSISTYIDDTPTAPVPPPFVPDVPSESYPHPPDDSSPVPHKCETINPELLHSPESEVDSLGLELQSLQSTPDVVRKAPGSRGSTLSRRLTFSLPFGSTGGGGGAAAAVDDEGVKPVERAVEARSHASDYIGSMVRCLHLTKCFIANTQLMSATLWAGTNSGAIFVFTISIPPSEKRGEVPLSVQLGKEIHLKHGAPVISVCILDGASRPFPEPMAVKKEAAPSPNSSLPHRVLICSEEQFKVFTLPQLKPFCKFKLTAHEGSRVRKIGYSDFLSSVDESYREPCFVVMTNMGDYSVYSLPDCRRQMYAAHIKKEDINGINSVVFSNRGESLYLMSPCELERVSLSARHITRPTGTIPVIKPQLVKEPEEETEPSKEKSNENQAEGDDGAANAVAAATAATAAAPETQEEPVNPQEKADNGSSIAEKDEKVSGDVVGESNRKVEEVKENGDNSVLSGDITIDSIRDHMDELKVSEKSVDVASTGSTTLTSSGGGGATVKQESSSVTVVKSTTITSVSSSSQGTDDIT